MAKQEIFDRLWPGTFVTENNLATLVANLRSALGDQASEPRFIRTVYAYGYAFVGQVVEPRAESAPREQPRWVLLFEGREIPLREGKHILGRTGPGVITLESSTVSRHHARVTITNGDAIRLGSLVVTIHALLDAIPLRLALDFLQACRMTKRTTFSPCFNPWTRPVRKCIPPNTRASTASAPACDRLL